MMICGTVRDILVEAYSEIGSYLESNLDRVGIVGRRVDVTDLTPWWRFWGEPTLDVTEREVVIGSTFDFKTHVEELADAVNVSITVNGEIEAVEAADYATKWVLYDYDGNALISNGVFPSGSRIFAGSKIVLKNPISIEMRSNGPVTPSASNGE